MKKLKSFILLFLLGSVLYGQNKSNSIVNAKPKLYFSFTEYGPYMNNYIQENNLEKVVCINDAQFFGKEPYTYDTKLLIKEIERVLPNINEKGIAFIDLEGGNLDNIMNMGTQIESFQKSLKLYVDVIKFAKKFRPNVKWGYYYIPYTTYWNRNAEFYSKLKKIEPLLKECDIFFPSLYNFYEDKDLALENEKYVIENTKEMIKVGQLYKKPVLVFVWHRYHPSNEKLSEESLPEKVFLTHIDRIISTSYQGKKVDGVLWWGADDYSFRQKSKGVIKEFKGNDKEFKVYNDKVLLAKSKKIKVLLDTNK
jgi:hypothetical protein